MHISRLLLCEVRAYTLLKVLHTHICALYDTLPSHVILSATRSHVKARCHKAVRAAMVLNIHELRPVRFIMHESNMTRVRLD